MKKLISMLTILSALSTPFGASLSASAAEPNASASAAPPASGPSSPGKHHRGGPCREDGEKFCAGMKWGEGLGKCLKEHRAEVSSACRTKMEKVDEYRAQKALGKPRSDPQPH